MRDRKNVNHSEDYEVRYSKPRPSRSGYSGNRKFAGGGRVESLTKELHKLQRELNSSRLSTYIEGDVSQEAINRENERAVKLARFNEVLKELRESDAKFALGGTVVSDLAGHTAGGDGGLNAGMPLDGFSNTSYTGLVGETGAMSSGEMFMAGGSVNPKFDLTGFKMLRMFKTLIEAKNYADESRKKFPNEKTIVIDTGKDTYPYEVYGTESFNKGKFGNRVYANGGGLPEFSQQSYMITEALGNPAQHFKVGGTIKNQYDGRTPEDIWDSLSIQQRKHFLLDHYYINEEEFEQLQYKRLESEDKEIIDYYANRTWKKLSGDVRKAFTSHVKEGQYNKGGALTNERLHVNHDEDYEVRYAKPRPSRKGYKGVRKFMAGGMNENTPRIYVADLEAYNSGRLVGEWLDLADYNDADELMDAIQNLLDGWGVEEYAIHDVEYVPSSMYSEYMGERDFKQLYEMMDLAKDNNLPLEVVQEIVSQYSESAVDEFQGKYDSATDFAEQLVDDLGGIQNFNDFEYYLDIYETDRRLLAQEMADSYVDDIVGEDGGNRIIEEAGLNVDEYEDASEETKEELIDLARSMVYDEYYDTWYEGLNDPYNFLVEEQGMYDAESFANASFVRVDYDKLAEALEQDYTMISYDGDVYVFNIR
jgi:antirestriction protein